MEIKMVRFVSFPFTFSMSIYWCNSQSLRALQIPSTVTSIARLVYTTTKLLLIYVQVPSLISVKYSEKFSPKIFTMATPILCSLIVMILPRSSNTQLWSFKLILLNMNGKAWLPTELWRIWLWWTWLCRTNLVRTFTMQIYPCWFYLAIRAIRWNFLIRRAILWTT